MILFRLGSGRIFGLVLPLLLVAFPALALGPHEPPGLDLAVHHLCTEVVSGSPLDAVRVAPLLDFVRTHAADSLALTTYADAPGAYQGFRLTQPLQRLLRYLYNPDIPEEALKPFSLRSSRWLDPAPDVRRLWQDSWPPIQTLVLRGAQEDQTTPDQSTGGWYRLRLHRALVLMPWKNAQVLISVSVQDGPSGIGAKGYIVGPDADCAYVYSDEPGLTKTGLGWVKSRIQTNISVAVYLAEPGQPVVNGVFQWMRAGWSGLSVVKTEHVAKSLQRYERELRRVLDASKLPEPELLEQWHAEIARRDAAALRREWTWPGLADASLPSDLARALENGAYLAAQDDAAVRSMVLARRMRTAIFGGS